MEKNKPWMKMYISLISLMRNLDLFIVFLVFQGNIFSSFGLHTVATTPGPAASTVLRGDASPPTVVEIPVFTSGFIHPRWVVVWDF